MPDPSIDKPVAVPQSAPTTEDKPARLLLEFLNDNDAHCPLCGYNCRALTEPRCPECGRQLRLTVGLVENSYRPFLALLLGLLPGCGLGAMFLLSLLRGASMGGMNRPRDVMILVVVIYFMACLPLSISALVLRRRFLKQPKGLQWKIAGTLLATSLLAFGGFISLVFLD